MYSIYRWRNEERASLAENAINAATEEDHDGERQPLLAATARPLDRNNRPMSPTSRSPRQQQVVGYIGNVQLFVNLTFILHARWRFKIVCLHTEFTF